MADEIPLLDSRATSVMARPSFQFDLPRYRDLRTNLSLLILFHIHRWHWNERGVYSFLSNKDRETVATTCHAARREHLERLTDDETTLSPTHVNGETDRVQA